MKFQRIIAASALGTLMATAAYAQIDLKQSAAGLEPLNGLHYEGWSIIDGEAVSTGRWNITSKGYVIEVNAAGEKTGTIGKTDAFFSRVSAAHKNASAYVLTIEPNGDTDAGPSAVHIVAGGYEGNSAAATVDHPAAIATDFDGVGGSFILAAPTGGEANQGIWFFDGEGAALDLPELPAGWNYEGWVVDTGMGKPISTGIFHDPNGADDDGAGAYAGDKPEMFPPAPGQDFVNGMPLELDNGNFIAVISVEPANDPDPAPFAIKILASDTITGNGELKPTGAALPTVNVTRREAK
ncbi:hypothetical protein [Cognatishimia sp.]|uniref:hypothetical protein n=1 Tax=Cognatishimia sp. TaxID=2211648 RepID=UPI0035138429